MLHIDKEVPPVAQQARRIPFHLHKRVEKELDHLELQGIIEDVEGPMGVHSSNHSKKKKNKKKKKGMSNCVLT